MSRVYELALWCMFLALTVFVATRVNDFSASAMDAAVAALSCLE